MIFSQHEYDTIAYAVSLSTIVGFILIEMLERFLFPPFPEFGKLSIRYKFLGLIVGSTISVIILILIKR